MADPTPPVRPWYHCGNSRYWRRILLVTAVGGLAAFGLTGGLVGHGPSGARWRELTISFIYANSIGGVSALAMPILLSSFRGRGRTVRMAARLVVVPIPIIAGCGLAS